MYLEGRRYQQLVPVIRHSNVTITIRRYNAITVIRYCSMIAKRL